MSSSNTAGQRHLVILGAGTAGTMMAHKLRKALPADAWSITMIDQDDDHVYQPGLLLAPFGMYEVDELIRPRTTLVPDGVCLSLDGFTAVDPDAKTVTLGTGQQISYDLLIIATGTRIAPEETPGLTGEGWHETAFDFYTVEGARALKAALAEFDGGTLAINIVDMPIKCPVAPLEFAFLADAYFTERGIRDKVKLVYVTPLDGAFTKPRAAAALGDMLASRGIEVIAEFALEKVDGANRVLHAFDGREVPYDLLATIPLHAGAQPFVDSDLGDALGFIPTDKHTLQSRAHPDIFAIGDGTDLPSSKAGSVAHFQGEVLFENVLRHIRGAELVPDFDGHANCFIETGHGKAMLIDFNYETEPLPGKFPLPIVGPFDLLSESHVNHWGKLGFRWVYWNILVRGEELPLDHNMMLAGKRS